jgi:ABC-type uncharacterized transport system substrate-binding protein
MTMKGKWVRLVLIGLLLLACTATPTAWAEESYRIGYLQGGDYHTYRQLFSSVMKELERVGWADRLVFPKDACFSAEWSRERCAEMAETLAARTDLDMIWAFGTWAGQEMVKTSNTSTPIVVMSVSNAVRSGIVPSHEDSGRDNLTTRIDPTKYERQVRLFYDVFRFKNLGFVYADTPTGRTYAALDMLKRLSKELGFSLVPYNKVPERKEDAAKEVLKGVREIAPRIDAYYMTICIGFELAHVPALMEVLNQHKIPSMAMYGSDYVKAGALMTIADSRYQQRARFTVSKVIKILEGAKPRDMPIVFAPGPRLALNLAEAKKIGWDPPIDILASADQVYNEIHSLEQVQEETEKDYGTLTVWDLCGKKDKP